MTVEFQSPYFQFSVRPEGEDGLELRVWSDQMDLAALPDKKRIQIALTVGSLAGAADDGGTGREEGYTFDLDEPKPGEREFTLHLEKLQPASQRVDAAELNAGLKIVQGVAALLLEDQKLTLYDAQGWAAAHLASASVILAEVQFVLLPAQSGVPFVLAQPDKLLTLTPTTDDATQLCIVTRDDFPSGLSRLPGSKYYVFSVPSGERVPAMALTFHLTPEQTGAVDASRIRVFFHLRGAWKELPGVHTLAAGATSLSATASGPNVFALGLV